VAGGLGSRMVSDIPKQFILIAGVPIIFRTIQAFLQFEAGMEVVVALPEDHFPLWQKLCEEHDFRFAVKIVKGGETRFHSVKNALEHIGDDRVVAIHDAVRPLVAQATIEQGFRDALTFGNAIPVITVNESVRWAEGRINRQVERDHLRIVQTPQVFDSSLIKKAYLRAGITQYTDDASVLEALGESIHLYQGTRENIKITFPTDLIFAESMLKR
jgi:2-C-methyl-D-erythritol 4-phosphate cytidylyltransferase